MLTVYLLFSITSVLWALIMLGVAIAVIYLVIWALGQFGLAIPANIAKIIWVILILLAIIFIINYLFGGGGGGSAIHIEK